MRVLGEVGARYEELLNEVGLNSVEEVQKEVEELRDELLGEELA